ncbi:MAG: response regulator [Magnetococcales bacterium]|nr:response regulator [Magnetococcales bacterium]
MSENRDKPTDSRHRYLHVLLSGFFFVGLLFFGVIYVYEKEVDGIRAGYDHTMKVAAAQEWLAIRIANAMLEADLAEKDIFNPRNVVDGQKVVAQIERIQNFAKNMERDAAAAEVDVGGKHIAKSILDNIVIYEQAFAKELVTRVQQGLTPDSGWRGNFLQATQTLERQWEKLDLNELRAILQEARRVEREFISGRDVRESDRHRTIMQKFSDKLKNTPIGERCRIKIMWLTQSYLLAFGRLLPREGQDTVSMDGDEVQQVVSSGQALEDDLASRYLEGAWSHYLILRRLESRYLLWGERKVGEKWRRHVADLRAVIRASSLKPSLRDQLDRGLEEYRATLLRLIVGDRRILASEEQRHAAVDAIQWWVKKMARYAQMIRERGASRNQRHVRQAESLAGGLATLGFLLGGVVAGLTILSYQAMSRRQDEMNQQLLQAKKRAEEADLARGMFLANMNHEIRTPLNAIIGLSHLCLKTPLSSRQGDYVTKIRHSAYSLLHIISDILDFATIEADRLEVDSVTFHLDDLLSATIANLSLRFQEKGLEFVVDVNSDVPSELVGDLRRLRQVLLNLAGNAIKLTEQGEVIIAIGVLETTATAVRLQFTVRDTGIGMTSELYHELFRAFTQADSSATRKFGGTGLGLALSRQLIHLMGGDIRLESVPNRGSSFTFHLPLGIANPDPRPWQVGFPDLSGVKILLVEDNLSARSVTLRYLNEFSLETVSAQDGGEVLALLQEAHDRGQPFTLVLMDCQLPGGDGMAVAASVRASPNFTRQPRIILCVAPGDEPRVSQLEPRIQIDGYLDKPILQRNLLYKVAEVLHLFVGNDRNPEQTATAPWQHRKAVSGAVILLVEDNEINRQLARELLQEANITVMTADNGQQAVAVAARERLDGVLMDIQMPVMDGLTATREIRKNRHLVDLPIIAVTANAMPGDRERCLEAGMQDYVAKPIDPDTLFMTLSRWIKPAARQNTLLPAQPMGASGMEDIQGSGDCGSSEIQMSTPPRILGESILSLPGIDTRLGLEYVDGNVDLFLRLLHRFLMNYAQAVEEIETAMRLGDRLQARRLVHTIKGLAGTMGAKELRVRAAALETRLGEAADDDVLELPSDFAVELNRVLDSIRHLEALPH